MKRCGNKIKYARNILLVLLAAILSCLTPVSTYALSDYLLNRYAQNNILFYDPDGRDCLEVGNAKLVEGKTIEEKVWNYFVNANISGVSNNPAVIAGIMGNLKAESGYDPFLVNKNGYTGIYQTYSSIMKPLVNKEIQNAPWYVGDNGDPSRYPQDMVIEAIVLELDYLTQKNARFTSNGYAFLPNLDKVSDRTPESYAELFLVAVEGAVTSSSNDETKLLDPGVISIGTRYFSSSNGGGKLYQAARKRRNYAKEIYDKYASSQSSSSAGSSVSLTSNIVWKDGWIVSGLEGYVKESADSIKYDSSANKEYSTNNGKPNKITLHNTEGTGIGLGAYSSCGDGKKCPAHFTVDIKKRQAYQHFPINKTSGAIKSYDGYAGVQIEIVGFTGSHPESEYYLRDEKNFSSEDWQYLAKLLIAISSETGIPLTTSVSWEDGTPRLSLDSYKNYSGIIGHMHAPGNDHGDPAGIWGFVESAIQSQNGGISSCSNYGELKSGGMTLEEAKKFMEIYAQEASKGAKGEQRLEGARITDSGCHGGALNNCSAFSEWFVNRYTTAGPDIVAYQGSQTVKQLLSLNKGFIDGGHVPKVYAVMSMGPFTGTDDASGYYNHTGIVLGIDEENDKIIIGEASCKAGFSNGKWPGAHEYSLKKYTATSLYAPTYAYTDNILKGGL